MKVRALEQLLLLMPDDADVVLRDPQDLANSLPIEDGFHTFIRTIDKPSHLVLCCRALEAREEKQRITVELDAAKLSQDDPRR